MKSFWEKNAIFRYIAGSFVKWFLIFICILGAVFFILKISGVYTLLETILNLKYNSPFVLIPLYGFAVLAVLSLVIGFLMYFHKYKRNKVKSKFYYSFNNVMKNKETDEK